MKYKTIKIFYQNLDLLDKQINKLSDEGWTLVAGNHEEKETNSYSILTFIKKVEYDYRIVETRNESSFQETYIKILSKEGWEVISSHAKSNSINGDKFMYVLRKEIK